MVGDSPVDEVYQLAADMGGIGFISNAECDIMKNNALINIHVVNEAAHAGVKRLFFSSSVCVYRDMQQGERELTEADAIPANPDNEYGWEKLYAERLVAAYGRKYGFSVRIARFQTAYGPEGTWSGGREKAPAAICRKVSEADNGGEVEVWGDGSAIRSYLYIDDLVGGVRKLMDSDIEGPTNIGSEEYLSVKQLVEKVIEVSGKDLTIRYVPGPVGVHSRNFSNAKIYQTGWRPAIGFDEGIRETYWWIDQEVHRDR